MATPCTHYNNSSPNLAIIFNYTNYSESETREGSTKDAEDLNRVLPMFNCEVKICQDSTKEETLQVLSSIKEIEYNKYSSILTFFLAHGDINGIFTKDEAHISINQILSYLRASKCPPFAGKPKLLVFQCCRVSEWGPANPIEIEPDVLVTFATLPGTPATRHITDGSPFIQHLVRAIEEHGEREDFLSILTEVTNKMDKTSVPHLPEKNSQLRRKVFLTRRTSVDLTLRKKSKATSETDQLSSNRLIVAKSKVHTYPGASRRPLGSIENQPFSPDSSSGSSNGIKSQEFSINLSIQGHQQQQSSIKVTLNEEENDGYINVIICEDVPPRPISENQISPESSSGSNNGISSPMNLSVQGQEPGIEVTFNEVELLTEEVDDDYMEVVTKGIPFKAKIRKTDNDWLVYELIKSE